MIGNVLGYLVIFAVGLISLRGHFAGGPARSTAQHDRIDEPMLGWFGSAAAFAVTILAATLIVIYVKTPFIWISALITLFSVSFGLRLTSLMSLMVCEVCSHVIGEDRFGNLGSNIPQESIILLKLSLLVALLIPLYVAVFRRSQAAVLSSYQNTLVEVGTVNAKLTTRGLELDTERARFRSLFNNSPEAYFVISAQVIVDCNKAGGAHAAGQA